MDTTFSTVRLDLSTKLSVMASVIYAMHSENISEADAVNKAIKINDLVDCYVKGLKLRARKVAA